MKIGQWLGIIALAVSLYILWQIRQPVLLVFTAIVLATILNAVVRRLQRWRLKRGWAIFMVIMTLLIVAIGVFLIVVPPLISQLGELVTIFPVGIEAIQQGIDWVETAVLEPYFPNIPDIDGLLERLQPMLVNLFRQGIFWFTNSIGAIAELAFVIALAVMLLINPQSYRQAFIWFFPAFYRPRVEDILNRCATGLEHWIRGALIEMVFIGFCSWLVLWILQVPLALAHAVLAGLLNFIPNIGPTIAAIFPITIAFLDEPWKAPVVLILYLIIQNIESYWLTPTVMANQVALLPAAPLTSQIFITIFFGPLGLFMTIPLTVVIKAWIEEVLFKDILDRWQQPTS